MATLAIRPEGRPPPNLDGVARGLGALSMGLGALVLVGWLSSTSMLASFLAQAVPCTIEVALALVLGGAAVWILARDPADLSPVPPVLGGLVIALGLLSVGEHLLDRELGLDQLLWRQSPAAGWPVPPGRATLGTTLGLVLAGAAILLRRLHSSAAAAARLGVLLLGALTVIEHILGSGSIDGPTWRSTTMALPTALGLIAMGSGLALLRPRRGFAAMLTGHGPGATLARRMAPVALAVPVGVAWLARVGVDLALPVRHESLSLGVVAGMALLLSATHWTSVALQRTERSRQRARERLARRERQLEEALHREREARRRADFEAATHGTLRRLATSFSQHREQDALIQHIVDEATTLVDATVGTLVADTSGEAGTTVRLRASSGLHVAAKPVDPGRSRPPSVASMVPSPSASSSRLLPFDVDAVVCVDDTRDHPDAATWIPVRPEQPTVRSVLGAHVVTRAGKVLGSLIVGHPEPGHFGEDDAALIEKVAELAATALETAQLMAALRRSEAQAHAADRRKDEFLALLGHELRNPVAPIAAGLEVLRARSQPGVESTWAIIDRQMRHLRRLLDDLLDIARIGRGTLEVTPHPTALHDVVTLGVEMVSGLVDKRRHTLAIDVQDDAPRIVVDEHRIAQVVANLLSNAAKYTEPGGHLQVTARRSERAATLVVRDDGPGIDDASLATLFGPFVQGPRAADRADGGLGLGLALARAIVEMHGGTITGQRLRPRGSEFTVVLPQDHVPATEAPPATRRHHQDRALHVLVVDDNEDAAQMLSILLGSWGYQCSIAVHPNDALEQLDREHPDAAIVDIGLPDMSGYELVGRMRRTLHDQALIVALTGYGQSRDRERALEAGFDAHFTKPVSSNELRAMLDDFARQRDCSPSAGA